MIILKVREIGGSIYVILNKKYARELEIRKGDYVIERLKYREICIKKLKVKE